MKLYIPEIGDNLILSKDWTFNLYDERRNEKLINHFKLVGPFEAMEIASKKEYKEVENRYEKNLITYQEFNEYHCEYYRKLYSVRYSLPVTLKAGSMLKVDRIFIRKGADDYSSVSFYYYSAPDSKKSNGRFWAKLADVNSMEIEDV